MIDSLPISFAGAEYRGCNTAFCHLCQSPEQIQSRYIWVIYENGSGKRITLCERHYKQWESKKEQALLDLSKQFRTALEQND